MMALRLIISVLDCRSKGLGDPDGVTVTRFAPVLSVSIQLYI